MSHSIALVNLTDGSVQGHKAGCADLSRGKLRKHSDDVWTFDVETKHEAWAEYNSDFLQEGPESGNYSITWLPCAKHVPQGAEDTYEAWEAEQAPASAVAIEISTQKELEETPDQVVTKKVGSKWTYIYVDGQLVAEIRNDQAALLAAI